MFTIFVIDLNVVSKEVYRKYYPQMVASLPMKEAIILFVSHLVQPLPRDQFNILDYLKFEFKRGVGIVKETIIMLNNIYAHEETVRLENNNYLLLVSKYLTW